jgi:hypothetical protein
VCVSAVESVCAWEREKGKTNSVHGSWDLIYIISVFFFLLLNIFLFFFVILGIIYIYIYRERERESSEFYGYCFLRYTECKATCYFVQKTNLTRLYMNALTRCRWRTQIIYMWFYVSLDHRIWNHWFCAEL